MRIKFVQSGGFGGFIKSCELESSALNEKEMSSLESLVAQGSIKLHSKTARDLINYNITIEKDDEKIHFSFDDLNIPETALPLLEFLISRAKP